MPVSDDEFVELLYLEANPDVAAAVQTGTFKSGRDHFERHGRQEGRNWDPSIPRSREEKLLNNIDRTGRGLEIGPSHRPIAPKSAGFNVEILDHLSSTELRNKYAEHGVNLQNIEEVDFVWSGEALPELIGRSNFYDWIIASHVIEHTPDLISFLQQCETLLKPNGRLALIIPDKRYCFDHFQPVSLTGAFLDAYQAHRIRPTPGQVFDHLSNAVKRDVNLAWDANAGGALNLVHSFAEAREVWDAARSGDQYFDVHCWRFTPPSFKLVISDLNALKLINLSVCNEYDTAGCEFHSVLVKGAGPTISVDRLNLLNEL